MTFSAVFRRGFALVIAAALCSIGAASAQQAPVELPSYDVELVIFRTLSSNATPEDWALELAATGHAMPIPEEEPSPFDTAPQAAPDTALATFPVLPPAKFELTAIEEALRRSRNFRPLAHIGWTQPGYQRGSASFVPIDAMVPASSGLSGQIALSVGRFLHLTLDLVYDRPASDGQPAARFVLRQSRRMRSNERHYIDHPQFGVIALVRPAAAHED